MFGNTKPFGTASTFGASSFGNTSTPFGQNTTAFGAKPATSNVFGASTFGVSTPNAHLSGGLFGTTTPASGTGLFGQPSTAFGAPASTSTGGFGFGATSTSGGLFGSSTPSTQQSSSGLFGNTSTSAFGSPRPAFGGFNSTTAGTGLFGQTANTGTSLFGSSTGFTATAPTGTTVKFNPPTGTDTMMKGGVSTSIGTRHQCITCMKEYENKSLEELRVEDYAANRKGGTPSVGMGFGAQTQQPGLFGAPAAASTSAFSFGGTTQAKPLFGTTGATNTFGSSSLFGQPAQNQNTGIFGKSVGFGAPATSAAPVFNFGASTGTSLFGQSNQQKPLFGQTTGSTGLFGSTATTQATGFGTNTGFGAFGGANQQSTGLFGAKPTGFGTTNTTTTNTFSFGNTNNMSGGLFGQKPAAPAFGTGTAFGTPSTGFGSFGTTPATGTGLFGQTKPAPSAFGSTGNMFGGGLGTSFGNSSFSMGLGTNTGTGLFGATNTSKAPGFNFGNTGSTGFNFGATNPSTSSFNFGPSPAMPTSDPNAAALQQAQQQILAMTVNPFGDSPLFRNPIKDSPRETELLKPTNPSAQKALLNDSHYKVALLPTAKIKPKPWAPAPTGKMLLFDGLEDEEPSLGTAAFLPKRRVKKLVLKNNSSQSSFTVTSSISPSQATRIDVSISLKSPNKSNTDQGSKETPLTVDISDSGSSNKETRTLNIRPSSGSRSNEALAEITASPNLRVSFNNSMNDSIAALHTKKQPLTTKTYNVWSDQDSSYGDSLVDDTTVSNKDVSDGPSSTEGHPTGIILTDPSYYTNPTLDEMIPLIDDHQQCLVKDFTIGRKRYGEVTFPGVTNVFGLNLSEIVSFDKKEITVYPNEEKKPPVGEGLNRKARVTLENVWPTDKTNHCLIKDPERISRMGYREKIERCTTQLGAKFIDYIPETGSWIFEVEHFSKYGLEDSDEEMDVAKPPEKKSVIATKKTPIELSRKGQPGNTLKELKNQELRRNPIASYPSQDQEMETLSSQLLSYPLEFIQDEDLITDVSNHVRPGLNSDIDAERIQGMKVSFFHEDVEDENWGSSMHNNKTFSSLKKGVGTEENIFHYKKQDSVSGDFPKRQRYLDTRDDLSYMSSPAAAKYSEIGVQKSLSTLSISSQLPEWLADFPVVKSSFDKPSYTAKTTQAVLNKIFLKPFKDSVLYEKQHLLSDAGYFMGRSFRVGWAADGTFAYPYGPHEDNVNEMYRKFLCDTPKTIGRSSQKSSFTVTLQKLTCPLGIENDKRIEKTIVDALELQLQHSESRFVEGIPIFVTNSGSTPIHHLADLFENLVKDADPLEPEGDFIRQCSYVWDLLVSLWGKVKGLDSFEKVSNYSAQLARREALSEWLIKTTDQSISKNLASTDDYLSKIFLYMNGRRTADAVKLAQMHHDFRLSLLLSQAESNCIVRKLIVKQLLNWKQNGAYDFIKPNRMILYILLSGMLVYEDINCCENLNWKQVLALQLWYLCNPNASVQDVMKEYDQSFQGTGPHGNYAAPPYALYIEDVEFDENFEASDKIFDTCYHILKLYCDRSHRFDLLLMPETYSPDHLDYRLSWLLLEALSAVGYNIPADIACTLHMNFASQLESVNLWQWSIFVLLHHPDKDWRTKQVKDVLLRCVSLEQNEEITAKEKFLEQLHIPQNWIYEAKAVKANTLGKRAEEAWYLLKAGSWSKSHSVVIKYLASDAVINEDYDYLLKYLNELSLPNRCLTILDWPSGGQVYLDYINMSKVVQDVLSQEASAYDLEKFRPQVLSICERLSSIPANSLKDRLSIAEMAKKTATILRSISILQASRNNNTALLTMLASSIQHLPMPHDYAVSDYRFVAHTFLEEKATEI